VAPRIFRNLLRHIRPVPLVRVARFLAQRLQTLFGGGEIPVVQFLGDIVITADSVVDIPIQHLINGLCTGFAADDVNGSVQVSINGGGLRTLTGAVALSGSDIKQLQVQTGPLSSVIITFFRTEGSPDRGYYILFAVTLGFYLALFYETFAFKVKERRAPFLLFESLRDHFTPKMRPVMVAYFIWGLRNGIFWFLMGVLVYKASHRELAVGAFDMVTQGIMLVMTYALSRVATSENRGKGLGISAWLDVAGVALLAWRLDVQMLLIFTVVAAVSGALFQVTFTSYYFDIMGAVGGEGKRTLENLTVREIPLNLGRVVGLIIFMVCCDRFGDVGLKASVLVLGSAHVGVWWILTRFYPNPGKH